MTQTLEEKKSRILELINNMFSVGFSYGSYSEANLARKSIKERMKTEYDATEFELWNEIESLVQEVERDTDKVTRVEVIDHTKSFEEGGGRAYVNWNPKNKVKLSFQDEGRTLKVFISNQQDKQE